MWAEQRVTEEIKDLIFTMITVLCHCCCNFKNMSDYCVWGVEQKNKIRKNSSLKSKKLFSTCRHCRHCSVIVYFRVNRDTPLFVLQSTFLWCQMLVVRMVVRVGLVMHVS